MAKRTPRLTRAEALRGDFDRLGRLLVDAEGSGAAAIARERRIIGELLERLEATAGEVPPLVDQLAQRRRAQASDSGTASRRRKPG